MDIIADVILEGVRIHERAPLAWVLIDAIDRRQEMR